MTAPSARNTGQASVFAGVDVCHEAGLHLPDGHPRPVFEHDVWDFTDVIGLPTQMARFNRRFDFTQITNTSWHQVAKELILAMLAPRHPAVAALPRAYRTPLHLSSAFGRLGELTRLLNWLTEYGITRLAQVDEQCCQAFLAHRRYLLDTHGVRVGERSTGTRRAAAQAVVDLINYRELFASDRVAQSLRPWGSATPSAVAEMRSGREQNKTPPVPDTLLQPMLANALYLVNAIGPHAVELASQIREFDRRWSHRSGIHKATTRVPTTEFHQLLDEYRQRRQPLPLLPEHNIAERLASGWSLQDPLTSIALGVMARQSGFTQFHFDWLPHLREPIESTLRIVGAEKPFARYPDSVESADGGATLPWTLPLHRLEAIAVVGVVRTAAITLVAAVTGMRSSELMELRVGCRRPPEHHGPDQLRYRVAGTIVKGQPLGGLQDEWVVIEPAYRAIERLEQLHDNPLEGAPLFGRIAFDVRHKWLRNWVNGEAGRRLGLVPIPETPMNLRMLRRTLAIELAYRPGGVLAAKLHLKHISIATTEGYASRPGGAQAELLAEVNRHESERNLELLWAEFRNYRNGVKPAGPGARELIEFFAHIDGKLSASDAEAPKVQRNDREVLNLLTKRARTLHLGAANYCWFTDPSRALCLKLAGTPHATKPLAGMCDSSRCPQATHHQVHRPIWERHAHTTQTFLGQLGPTRKTEKARLQADHDRALQVLAAIDNATTKE